MLASGSENPGSKPPPARTSPAPNNSTRPSQWCAATLRLPGSTTQTAVDPAANQPATLAASSVGRSSGETTSTARSGAPGKKPIGIPSANRSARTKETSGARTVLHKPRHVLANLHGNRAVPRAGRRHHDQLSEHQFTPADILGMEQVFGSRNRFDRCHEDFSGRGDERATEVDESMHFTLPSLAQTRSCRWHDQKHIPTYTFSQGIKSEH